MRKILLIFFIFALNCSVSFALDQQKNNETNKKLNRQRDIKTNSDQNLSKIITTKIRSDFINVKRQQGTILLKGKVILERQDVSILADQMKVFYYQKPQNDNEKKYNKQNRLGEKSNLKKIEATDNIKIFNDEFNATGKFGIYDPEKNIFILEKNVILNKGTSSAKGDKFVYNMTTKKGRLLSQKKAKFLPKNTSKSSNNDYEDDRVMIIIDDENIKKINNSNK